MDTLKSDSTEQNQRNAKNSLFKSLFSATAFFKWKKSSLLYCMPCVHAYLILFDVLRAYVTLPNKPSVFS